MKNIATPIVVSLLALCTSIVLVACQSHEQKADDTFEYVRKEKRANDSITAVVEAIIVEKTKPKVVTVITEIDEWTRFKNEVEKKIIMNETKIKQLKNKLNSSSKSTKKITTIENENNDLMKKMEEYKEEEKVKRENFKTDFNHQVNSIGIDLDGMK